MEQEETNGKNSLNASAAAKTRKMSAHEFHQKEMDTENRLEEVGIIQPPDGGYGWVVVFASFLANAIVDGVIFSIGETILSIWEREFNANTATVSVATSLLAGSYLVSGPLASSLANHFGCNVVSIAGSLIAALGFFISALMPALPVIYITFGVIGGVGFGLIFLPAVVIVGQYFSTRRALATGIAVCGSGIGTSLFSYLNPVILAMCGDNWRFFMFAIAGVTCSCSFCGYFFKPLQPKNEQVEEAAAISKAYFEQKNTTEIDPDHPTVEIIDDDNKYIPSGTAIERLPRQHHVSLGIDPTTPFLSTLSLNAGILNDEDAYRNVTRKSLTALNRPLSKPDIFYPGSTQKLNLPVNAQARSRCHSALDTYPSHASQMVLSTAALPTTQSYVTGSWTDSLLSTLKMFFDYELLYSPTFHILAISGFLTLTCFFVPFMFLGQVAIGTGVAKENTKYLVIALGLVNVLGRIICGFISDHPSVDPLWVTNLSLITAGIATILVPWATVFWHYIVYCIFFATGVACFAALRSIIVVEVFGLERLTNAYGILLLYMGVAAFVGPPFAAYLKTITDDYTLSFIVMGSLMLLSGLIAVPLRRIHAWEQARNTEKAHPVELSPLTNGHQTA